MLRFGGGGGVISVGQRFSSNGFTPTSVSGISAWYDPSDISTLFQDVAGTTPVTADGDPVARVNDKSGNSHNLLQATSSKRPIYKTSGGLSWLLFDGVDDILSATFTIPQPFVRVTGIKTPASISSGTQILGGAVVNTGVLFYSGTAAIGIYSGVTLGTVAVAISTAYCTTERHNGASSRVAINNGSYTSGDAGSTLPGGVSVGGSQAAGSGFSAISYYGGAIYAADVSAADIARLRTFVGAKSGLTL